MLRNGLVVSQVIIFGIGVLAKLKELMKLNIEIMIIFDDVVCGIEV